tara:strand:+ start:352 stop:600 length:249 start_codon:yes stop_codon:yes gene_type:complete
MQIGLSKKVSEHILEDLLELITRNIKSSNKLKISKFGTFILRDKKARIGRNPKTKVSSIINQRKVISFKASKEFKNYVNSDE